MIGYLGMLAQLADFNPRRKFNRSIRDFRKRLVWMNHILQHRRAWEEFMDFEQAAAPPGIRSASSQIHSDHAAHVRQHLEDLRL